MADLIVITPQPIITTNTNFTAAAAIEPRLAIDVSAYDLLDVQLNVLSFNGVTTLDVHLVHAFQNSLEDYTWDITNATSTNILGSTSATAQQVKIFQSPAANSAMLKYMRWRAKVNAGTAVWTLTALARRRSF